MDYSAILIPLLTLVSLEVILGIDNVIFISILADKLPVNQRDRFRLLGMGGAVIMRLALLTVISWIMKLNEPFMTILNRGLTGKDVILILGGLFLLFKSTKEIFYLTEVSTDLKTDTSVGNSFGKLLIQVLILDLVFSIDSIITAVGMVDSIYIMYAAIIISVFIMLLAAKPIHIFISAHPSFKVLALSFLLIIGIALIGEGLGMYIPKGYIYFAMAFSFLVDIVQMRMHKNINKK